MKFPGLPAAVACAISLLLLSSSASGQALTTEIVATGLSSPLDLESPPGDSRLFIAEQTGRIRIVENGTLLAAPYFDGTGLVASGSFTGLRGLAFHPDYANNGFVYIAYDTVSSGAGDVVIDRLTVSAGDPNVVEPSSRVEIYRITQTYAWHGGGDMAFGPDGYLYTAHGDGHGQGNDPFCSAQDGSKLLGKMLRLDVDGAFPYAVPPGNPFVGNAAVLDEVWAAGMRHPWRWSFDSATGDLYIADVGQHGQEEIDFIPAGTSGQNFGWKVMEGTSCFNTSSCGAVAPCNDSSYTDPIFTQSTGLNCSITGGFVYRGSAIPSEQGNYFFGAYCSGSIWSLAYDGNSVSGFGQRNAELGVTVNGLTSFGQDAFGELYTIQQNGTVRKIVPVCDPSGLDCNGNGLSDDCDIIAGNSQDANGDGVPDECIGTLVCLGVDCPCGNDNPSAGCINSSGVGGSLTADPGGSVSISTDNLRLDAKHPPANSGLLLVNTMVDSAMRFFDGLNCVRGGPRTLPGADIGGMQPFGDVDLVGRDGVRNLGSTNPGAGLLGLIDMTFPNFFQAGGSYAAQFWHRDVLCGPPPAPCPSPCATNANFTNALLFTVAP